MELIVGRSSPRAKLDTHHAKPREAEGKTSSSQGAHIELFGTGQECLVVCNPPRGAVVSAACSRWPVHSNASFALLCLPGNMESSYVQNRKDAVPDGCPDAQNVGACAQTLVWSCFVRTASDRTSGRSHAADADQWCM